MSALPIRPPWLKDVSTNAPPKVEKLSATGVPLHSQSPERIKRRTEENLTPRMKERRDRFIAEMVKGIGMPAPFNSATNAMIRSGGAYSTAAKMSNQFMKEPYFQKKWCEIIAASDAVNLLTNGQVMALALKEATYTGIGASHGARVSAIALLAKIKGMEAPTKIEAKVKFAGGVMLVPMAASVDEWEKTAEATQKELKDVVRD